MANLDTWLKFYQSTNPIVKRRALRGLLLSPETPPLTALLDAFVYLFANDRDDDNPDMLTRELRGRTINALKQRADPAVVEPLLPFARHPSPLARAATCEILGTAGDWRATSALLACLDGPIPFVQMAAAFALAALRDPEAAAAVKARYDAHPTDDINVRIALESAMNALGVAYTPHPWRPS